MNKKQQKDKKQANNLHRYFINNSSSQQKTTPPTAAKNQGKKKLIINLNQSTVSKDRPVTPLPPKKLQLHSYLKQISLEQILQKCPQFQRLIKDIAEKVKIQRKTVKSVLKKYLESSSFSLWSTKYAPRQISQLFNIEAGKKIKDWLNAFFEYKNKINEEDSFINDGSQQYSCKIKKSIQDHQWRLLALIVRGRPGVGKTTAIRAVAREMEIDLQQCGNEYNQTKYLKQKNQSTQSQSVKTAYSQKQKIEKNAQMITKFISFLQKEKEKPKETKKGQMFHNISMIYPQCQAYKFYNQLSRCVQLSKIPFIMTNSGQKMPAICEKYDIIQYQTVENTLIDKILYVIYHLQSLQVLEKTVLIQKQELFTQINRQIQHIQFHQLCTIESIHEICLLFNYRLDYIFTFLQYQKKSLHQINFLPMIIEKFKTINQDKLLQEILFIDFQKLKGTNINRSSAAKMEEVLESQQTDVTEKPKESFQPKISTYVKKLKVLALQDTLGTQDYVIPYSKDSFNKDEWQKYPYTCIEIPVHHGIKKSLVNIANFQINSNLQRNRSTLKIQELSYLHMLIREKRANRTSRVGLDTLKKIYDANEYCYLEKFGHFIAKPEN